MSLGPATWPATAIGGGNDIYGYWLGDASSNKLVVSPKSTETSLVWGSAGTFRTATSTTNGITNTNTLYAFGSAAHPAAYYCKTLTTGGYNTWYLPAKDESTTIYANKAATPFASANSFIGGYYWMSTEFNPGNAWKRNLTSGAHDYGYGTANDKNNSYNVRAIRRSTI